MTYARKSLISLQDTPYYHAVAHGLRGALLKELNRFDEAREALKRAIALANSIAEAKLIRRELDGLAMA